MNRLAARVRAAGVERSACAADCLHSETCVLSSESICARRRDPVTRYTARKLPPMPSAVATAIAIASCGRRPAGSSRLSTGGAEAVADVADGLDRIRAIAGAKLAAQVADVDLEHLGSGIEVEAPDGVED